jgi:hypothetical protein
MEERGSFRNPAEIIEDGPAARNIVGLGPLEKKDITF